VANLRFLLGVKPGDHGHLFDAVLEKIDAGEGIELERVGALTGTQQLYHFVKDVPLNESSGEQIRGNFLLLQGDRQGLQPASPGRVAEARGVGSQLLVGSGRAKGRIRAEESTPERFAVRAEW
jgi:hypothetical protein